MAPNWGSLRTFGWLPAGQAVSLVISTVTFAVLARTLGTGPFAVFATVLFVFSVVSLLCDLSPQGFIIVHGDDQATRRATWFIVAATSAVAGAAIFVLTGAASLLIVGEILPPLAAGALSAACIAQYIAQVPRARLVIARRYKTLAIVDISATLVAGVTAVAVSLVIASVIALAVQLLVLGVVRGGLLVIAERSLQRGPAGDSEIVRSAHVLRYGARVLPVNIASYLSRSLDTGFLPAFLPAAAAAAYARSYQLVVVPIGQIQLSLGPAILERLSTRATKGVSGYFLSAARQWPPLCCPPYRGRLLPCFSGRTGQWPTSSSLAWPLLSQV